MVDLALPIFTCIGAILTALPAPSHWRAKNFVVLALIIWIIIGNFNTFVNRIIWMKSYSNIAPVWCDISIKLMSMVTMGIPCATFCISKKLEAIASLRQSSRENYPHSNQIFNDVAICWGLPITYALLTIINQGHRFNIVEGLGCSPAIFLSPVSIVIDYGLPLLMSCLSIIYSVLALKHFITHKKDFESLLVQSGSTLSIKKFLRMISFTLIDLIINFPILLTEFILELLYKKVEPYASWSVVHAKFSRVSQYPAYVLNNPEGNRFTAVAELSAWMVCASGIIFFFLFGFSVDARADYAKVQKALNSLVTLSLGKSNQRNIALKSNSQLSDEGSTDVIDPSTDDKSNFTSWANDMEKEMDSNDS